MPTMRDLALLAGATAIPAGLGAVAGRLGDSDDPSRGMWRGMGLGAGVGGVAALPLLLSKRGSADVKGRLATAYEAGWTKALQKYSSLVGEPSDGPRFGDLIRKGKKREPREQVADLVDALTMHKHRF